MKYTLFVLMILTVAACNNSNSQPSETVSESEVPAVVQPAVQPSGSSPYELRNLVRNTLRLELPHTFSEQRGDRQAAKTYSFKVESNNGRPTWVIKEKLHDVANNNKIYAGADYMLLCEVIDYNSIKIVNTSDGKTAISIQPIQGNTFVYHPYTSEPDVAITEVILGWYDHTQDQTLHRLYTYLRQLGEKMDNWNFDE